MAPGAPRGPRLSWLAVSLPVLGVRSGTDLSELDKAHPGCFFKGFEYRPLAAEVRSQPTLAACQESCLGNSSCAGFSYWPEEKRCQFAEPTAERVPTAADVLSGAPSCNDRLSSPACTTELPRDGFPSYTPAASNEAWPSGKQPGRGECWPKDLFGSYGRCENVIVLEEAGVGWPGKCKGLTPLKHVLGVQACEALCRADPKCASWQVAQEQACYHGLGESCYVDPGFTPVAAQRLMHGQVRTLMDLKGWHIMGLTRVFMPDPVYFQSDNDAVRACRRVCYSSIECTYWQYATKFGCWVDAATDYRPPVPLTLSWASRSTPFAMDCIAGEMIQHFCTATSVQAEDETEVVCAQRGGKYEAVSWVDETVATSPLFCQRACKRKPECQYFTFFPKGLCRLFRQDARLAVADESVVYGPRDCSTTQPPTEAPAAATPPTATVVISQSRAGPTIYTLPAPPHERGSELVYMVGTNYSIHHLDFELLSEEHRAGIRRRLAFALAAALQIPAVQVTDAAEGGAKGQVHLAPGYNAKHTRALAWVKNKPETSADITGLKELLVSEATLGALEGAVQQEVHVSSPAVSGSTEITVADITTKALVSGEDEQFTASWSMLLFLVLVCCLGTALLGHCLQRGESEDTDGSDAEQVGFVGSRQRQGGPLQYVQTQARNVAKAARAKLPHHRGEFTV